MFVGFRALLASMVALLGIEAAWAQTAISLAADLSVDFHCTPASSMPDLRVEGFLAEQGFRVMNRARAFERFGGTPLQPFEIIALDKRSRIIRFGTRSGAQGTYNARLHTRPPTQRAPELEDRLVEFVRGDLGCEVVRLARGRNEADAQALHDRLLSTYEGWFRQLDEMERRPL